MKYGKLLFGVFALCETSGHGRNPKIFQKKNIELSMSLEEKNIHMVFYEIYSIKYSKIFLKLTIAISQKFALTEIKSPYKT